MAKQKDHRWLMVEEHKGRFYDNTLQKYLRPRLDAELTDFNTRLKTTKKVFHYKAKPPLYVDRNHLFLCMRSYRMEESLYINYFAIKSFVIHKSAVDVCFHSGHGMRLSEVHTFRVQIARCLEMIEFLKNEKVFS